MSHRKGTKRNQWKILIWGVVFCALAFGGFSLQARSRFEQSGRGLSPDEHRVEVSLVSGESKTIKGRIRGYKTSIYAIRVLKGQKIKVTFGSVSDGAYFNVIDEADSSGAALFIGQASESRTAEIQLDLDGIVMLQPYLVRSAARRGEVADFVFHIELKTR